MVASNRRKALLGLAASVALPGITPSQAQSTPTYRLVVPFAPGGPTDIVARIFADSMRTALNGTVLVENRPGAGGVLGLDYVSKAPPDGTVLGVATLSNMAAAPAMATLTASGVVVPYEPLRSFTPIATMAVLPGVTLVNPSRLPAKTFRDLVAMLKAQPGKFNYASAGTGSASHFYGEQFKAALGVFLVHIPYRGTGPALVDTISGETQVAFDAVASALSHVRSGRLLAVAVSAEQRLPELSAVPTYAELGHPELSYATWFGIVAPAGLPDLQIRRISAAVQLAAERAANSPAVRGSSIIPVAEGPEALRKRMQSSLQQHMAVVKTGRIRPE
jgi:tripartite-type tricarboxylate transporter receptor subunit TctC